MRCFAAVLVVIGAWLLGQESSWAQAVESPRALADLIPEDIGLCIELHNVPAQLKEFADTSLGKRWQSHPWLTRAIERQTGDLNRVRELVQRRLNMPLPDLQNRVLGGDVLLAVWPPAENGAPAPSALLVRPHDSAGLRNLVNFVVAQQQKAGRWQASRVVQEGAVSCTVHLIQPAMTEAPAWLAVLPDEVHGDIGVVTTSEASFRKIFAAFSNLKSPSLARSASYLQAKASAVPTPLARVFLNVRPWDRLLQAQTIPADRERAQARRALLALWQSSQSVVATLALGEPATAEVHWHFDRQQLPIALRQVVAQFDGATRLASALPAEPLLVIAGRCDIGGYLQNYLQSSSTDERVPSWLSDRDDSKPKAALRMLTLAVASGIGPELAVAVFPRQQTSGNDSSSDKPWDWLIAADTQPLEPAGPPLAETLDPLLRTWLQWNMKAMHAENNTVPTVVSSAVGERRLTTVRGLPAFNGRSLTYSVYDSRIWLGTAESLLREPLSVVKHDPSATSQAAWQRLQNPRCAPASQMAFIDVAKLREILPQGLRSLPEFAPATEAKAGERPWRDAVAGLSLVDRLLLEARSDTTGLAVSLRVE